jgi:hypothetical protein
MMNNIVKRLRASIGVDAINGDSFERSVCAAQMKEAADEIERLQNTLQLCADRACEAVEALPNDSGIGKASDMVRLMALHDAIVAIRKALEVSDG